MWYKSGGEVLKMLMVSGKVLLEEKQEKLEYLTYLEVTMFGEIRQEKHLLIEVNGKLT